ncbi:hypothetical protein OJF2_34600 [Aquisphaera giovannonii]|uniref:FPG-type domain-containing protein n=1 Tax=Aquisphaera giovannonii TaxID=406548 RepID=A0A5B9W487_9BACT|nr:hypothetical protein OJF2_34600 [Aquisphaera giovannonii]
MSLLKVIVQAIRERRLPSLGWASGGVIRSGCPRCGEPIVLSKVEAGRPAFRCPACGEGGAWKAGP